MATTVTITSPETSSGGDYRLTGTVSAAADVVRVDVRVNGAAAEALDAGDAFAADLVLRAGRNTVYVEAEDAGAVVGFDVIPVDVATPTPNLTTADRMLDLLIDGIKEPAT